jgi:hypothetical protein
LLTWLDRKIDEIERAPGGVSSFGSSRLSWLWLLSFPVEIPLAVWRGLCNRQLKDVRQ